MSAPCIHPLFSILPLPAADSFAFAPAWLLLQNGTEVYGEYTPLTARDILTKDLDALKLTVREFKEQTRATALHISRETNQSKAARGRGGEGAREKPVHK